MLFSTKAEYGVRLMVELGRRAGDAPHSAEPVALAAVAEAETLPLSYLEHLVAKLRQAGLVTSVRGAHGGDRPAPPPRHNAMVAGGDAPGGPQATSRCSRSSRPWRARSRRWSASTPIARGACCARTRPMRVTPARPSCS